MAKEKIRVLDGETASVNQILPFRQKWAWDMYEKAIKNNWIPTEVPMSKDIQNWKSNDENVLSEDERLVLKRCMGFFAGTESLVANNLVFLSKWITDPCSRQYMSRQMYEECLHNHTVVYVCESLGLNQSELYEAYKNIPSIKAKDDFLMSITTDLSSSSFETDTVEGKRELLKSGFAYWVICEGIFFYSGFAMLLAMHEKFPGIAEQIQYTLRDESLHIEFGANILNTIKDQYKEVWIKELEDELTELVKKAVELEIQYAEDVLPRGILGLNSSMFVKYMQFIANRRFEKMGMKFRYESNENPFPWMSEVIDTKKQKNFFETRVIDYQDDSALEDDY